MTQAVANIIVIIFFGAGVILAIIILPALTIAVTRDARRDLRTMKARHRANQAMKKYNH